jgi:hypothetical protein
LLAPPFMWAKSLTRTMFKVGITLRDDCTVRLAGSAVPGQIAFGLIGERLSFSGPAGEVRATRPIDE